MSLTLTSTVSPLGVLPACVPGITLNSKANGSASQPSSGWVAASASEALSAKTPGALHESVRADVLTGSQSQLGRDWFGSEIDHGKP